MIYLATNKYYIHVIQQRIPDFLQSILFRWRKSFTNSNIESLFYLTHIAVLRYFSLVGLGL